MTFRRSKLKWIILNALWTLVSAESGFNRESDNSFDNFQFLTVRTKFAVQFENSSVQGRSRMCDEMK